MHAVDQWYSYNSLNETIVFSINNVFIRHFYGGIKNNVPPLAAPLKQNNFL